MREVIATELTALAGLGMVFWGCWQIYTPAAWIVTGTLFLSGAILGHLYAAEPPVREP